MKEKGIHEGCIEQMQRLFADRLYSGDPKLDAAGLIRVDDWEMREDVQAEVAKLWEQVTTENIEQISDLAGYRSDFFNLFGFEFDNIDYNVDSNELVSVQSIVE